MYLLTVIPIARGISKETLSYFSANAVSPGSLVSAPVRSKFLNAIVISSEDAREAKSAIRSSAFAMKKIGEVKSERFLPESFMAAVRKTADFHAASTGSVLGLLVPKALLESPAALLTGENDATAFAASSPMSSERLVLQSDPEERFSRYRSVIREEFAKGKSVFFLAPDAENAARGLAFLGKGIENYGYGFYPRLPKKKLLASQKKAFSENHPVLAVATSGFFSLSPGKIGAVIVENESSRLYKSRARPGLDARVFAEFFAREIGAKLILGDTLLRVETLSKLQEGELMELAPIKWRSLSPIRSRVADMSKKPKMKPGVPGGRFEVIGEELEALIKNSHEKNERLFVFAGRRGLATQIVCRDCGEIVLCGLCRSPMALHRDGAGDGNQNFFSCHICGERRSAEERCKHCDSWKLEPLGVGSERVAEEMKRKFPSVKIFRVDKDIAPRSQTAKRETEKFYASPGSVLIGTETALPLLDEKIENSAVASLDSLFSLPDFRIHERIMHILLKIRRFTSDRLLIQTRAPEEKVIEYALTGNLMDFYRDEIAAREKFNYPPFKTLIKISLSGNRAKVAGEMEKLKQFFSPWKTETFPAFAESARGVFTMHALIRLERGVWVHKNLLQKLLALPPAFRVEVEPESLL